MTYISSEQYLSYLDSLGSHPGLEAVTELLKRLGNPQYDLRCIHIAGTNGKGSVSAYLTSILMASGYQTGTFTSPEIHDIRETICIDTKPITAEDFEAYLKLISSHCDAMEKEGLRSPTRFEVLTALSFLYFKNTGCHVVVLETGMGGRLDATNVLTRPLCCVITAIALDHTQFLGDTLEAIAYEKSGIIKPSSSVVLYPPVDSVYEVITKVCNQNKATLSVVDLEAVKYLSHDLSYQAFSYKQYELLKISLLGDHQVKNAAVAVEVVEVLRQKAFEISDENLYLGFSKAAWPGRFECIYKAPLFFIDGAHNTQGALALRDTLTAYFPNKKLIFIMGMLKDKDYAAVSQLTAPLAAHILVITPPNPRALDPYVLASELTPYCPDVTVCSSTSDAVDKALLYAAPEDVIVAFGSLYFIGELPGLLKDLKN